MRFRCVSAVIAFVLFFAAHSAGAQNLIPDPTFSSSVSAWAVRDPAVPTSTALNWNPGSGADGAPGFARLTGFGPGNFFARVCVPVNAGATYSWGGFLRLGAPLDYTAQFTLNFYANSSCEGTVLLLVDGPTVDASSGIPDAWHLRAGQDVVAPALAESVALEVRGASTSGLRRVDFDNVYFGAQGTGPPTVAVAVPTVSEVAFWVFAVFLALAGAWRIVKA